MLRRISLSLFILFLILVCRFLPVNKPTAKLSEPQTNDLHMEPLTNEIPFTKVSVNKINIDSTLLLVNSEYPLPRDASAFTTTAAYPTIPVSTVDVRLNSSVLGAVSKWFDDAKQMGYDNLYVSSGYRTYDKQTLLYKNAPDKAYVQKPGNSEHHTGLALDVAAMGVKDLGKTEMGKWLMDHAWKYGFLLRYPEDKREVTGIAYEPWHFRYVGFPHAIYCHEKNLTLEEYVQNLKNDGGYSLILNSTSYSVFYEKPNRGIIHVPNDLDYEVSSDNTGGYIVTVKDAPLIQNASK